MVYFRLSSAVLLSRLGLAACAIGPPEGMLLPLATGGDNAVPVRVSLEVRKLVVMLSVCTDCFR